MDIMTNKPITPKMHGIIDYIFSTVQAAGPEVLQLPQETKNIYRGAAAGFLAVNALTDTPVGICKVLSMKQHQLADVSMLAGMSLLTLLPIVRNNRKTLIFHLSFLTIAVAHYVLTDYSD